MKWPQKTRFLEPACRSAIGLLCPVQNHGHLESIHTIWSRFSLYFSEYLAINSCWEVNSLVPHNTRQVSLNRYGKLINQFCFFLSTRQLQDGHGRWSATVLPAVEWLPIKYGQFLQTPEGRKKLHWCHVSLWRTDVQSSQDGPLCVQSLLQIATWGKSI